MKVLHKNLLISASIGFIFSLAAVFGLLVGGVQSQTRTQCESWLQGLLTNPNGIQYILSNIHNVVAEQNRARATRIQGAGSVSEGEVAQEQQEPQEPSIHIVRVATKITEKNDAYYKFSWILAVKNDADVNKSFTAKIEWLDKDGFIIDDDVVHDLTIGANREKHFTGYALTDADVADTVSNVRAYIPTHTILTTSVADPIQPVSATISE